MALSEVFSGLIKPLTGLFENRQKRKMAKQAAIAKLTQGQQDKSHELNLSKDEWESLNVKGMGDTWKDEYVTVSVVSILNLILLGGVLTAFGQPELLTGVGIAIEALIKAGVDVGFILTATVMAGLGLSVWKRF